MTPAEAEKTLSLLTQSERRVLVLIAQDKSRKEVAEALCRSVKTVDKHLDGIHTTLNCGTVGAAVLAAKAGWV